MKITCAFTLSEAVVSWLAEKKRSSINLSSLVNQILEAEMIREMEKNLDAQNS